MRLPILSVLFLSALLSGCGEDPTLPPDNYRQAMRDFVQAIGAQARLTDPAFILIPQNGLQLLTGNDDPDGPLAADYVAAIQGVGQEDVFYGYDADDAPTPGDVREELVAWLQTAKNAGLAPLVIDYCATRNRVDDAYAQNAALGFPAFAADHRELDDIPDYPAAPPRVNADNVDAMSQVRNFLYLINPDSFSNRAAYLAALRATDHDLLIIDAEYDGLPLTAAEVAQLKVKHNGARRLVVAYMSIGEAEDYRWYWQAGWKVNPPAWLEPANPDWPGNYKVRYWDPQWQALILGAGDSYLNRLLAAGFDGAYLDIIDAFEYFEDQSTR